MRRVWDVPAVATGIERQLAALDDLLAGGAHLIGWKVGVGAPAAMAAAGIEAPLVGFLTSATVLPDGATVSVDGWRRPVMEPELGVRLARDIPGGADLRTVAAAVGGIRPAIELADVDVPLEDLTAVVAGNVYHRHVVLAEDAAERPGARTDGLHVRVDDREVQVAATDAPTQLTGDVVGLVQHVADWLATVGRRLSAGELVICGSTLPLLALESGARLRYRCEPLGELLIGTDAAAQ